MFCAWDRWSVLFSGIGRISYFQFQTFSDSEYQMAREFKVEDKVFICRRGFFVQYGCHLSRDVKRNKGIIYGLNEVFVFVVWEEDNRYGSSYQEYELNKAKYFLFHL